MSLELQKRASEFLARWSRKGLLPNLQDSWTERLIAYYADDDERIEWDAGLVDMIKSEERSQMTERGTSHTALIQ